MKYVWHIAYLTSYQAFIQNVFLVGNFKLKIMTEET
jgi:hypothetical protein